jgi:hypothetical protein
LLTGTSPPAPRLPSDAAFGEEANVTETVEGKIRETPVEARQGTGPRATVTVLTFSLFMAAVAGSALLAYFVAS